MISNFRSSGLHHLSAKIVGLLHSAHFLWCRKFCKVSTLSTEPCSQSLAQGSCKHTLILLPQSSKYWKSKHVPPCPASTLVYAIGNILFCLFSLIEVGQFCKYILNILYFYLFLRLWISVSTIPYNSAQFSLTSLWMYYFIKEQSSADWVSLPHIFQLFTFLSNFIVYQMNAIDILMVLCI